MLLLLRVKLLHGKGNVMKALTLAGLLNLNPGDVIPCDFTGRATVCAEDIPILRGTFGISRGQQAVKVDERVLHARPASTPQRASQPPTRRQSR